MYKDHCICVQQKSQLKGEMLLIVLEILFRESHGKIVNKNGPNYGDLITIAFIASSFFFLIACLLLFLFLLSYSVSVVLGIALCGCFMYMCMSFADNLQHAKCSQNAVC